MIGNTDWSVPYLHNIRLFDTGGARLQPVPYDFDHAGIVEANYARPAEQLPIHSVRQRMYRGLAYPAAIFQKVFDQFNQLKPQFYALYTNETRLNPAYVKRTLSTWMISTRSLTNRLRCALNFSKVTHRVS
jgi:hypothetical protein